MVRFKSVGTLLVVCAIVVLVIMNNPVSRKEIETTAASNSGTEETGKEETGEFQVDSSVQKANPEDAYVQIDDMVFQLGYCERLSDAVQKIEASGRYSIEGYDAEAQNRSVEISVSRDDTLLFILKAGSIKEYSDTSGVTFTAALFDDDAEKNMFLTGISVADEGMRDAWIFSGTRLDGKGTRRDAFLTRFGSYSSDAKVYPSLVEEKSGVEGIAEYMLRVEVNAPKQEVLSSRVLAGIHSLRTLEYTFLFDEKTQDCTSVSISSTVSTDEIKTYWNRRNEDKAKKTSTTAAKTTTAPVTPSGTSEEVSEPADAPVEEADEENTTDAAEGEIPEEIQEETSE